MRIENDINFKVTGFVPEITKIKSDGKEGITDVGCGAKNPE